ncbi:hypothetical protein H072_9139 [Dactylellina haptotyla CBS 200.50]|uniref:Uncharacterized protein n=1 Tax=Dactylellina haptotyla (strain CBS 200.50) TaxID=1284197 RepID=S8A2G2_DACHA|nr:hypothetical protein H072_9139 [Dactylellina haptotyla CBS 200.50]
MLTLAAIGLLSAAQLGAGALLPREAVTTSAEGGGYNNYYYYYPPSNTSTTSYESVTSYTYTQGYPTIDPTTVTDRNIYTYTNRYDGTAGTYTTDRPTPTKYTPHPSVFRTACAGISASYASALASYERRAATDTNAVYPTSIPIRPREAWDCLYSIPLDVDLTLAFIREVTKVFGGVGGKS